MYATSQGFIKLLDRCESKSNHLNGRTFVKGCIFEREQGYRRVFRIKQSIECGIMKSLSY